MELSFETFNILEGVFWIACAAVALLVAGRVPRFLSLARAAAVLLVAFGISDFVEISLSTSFLDDGNEWLLVVKVGCIVGLVLCFFRYVMLRIR